MGLSLAISMSPTRMIFWAIVLCLLLVLSQSGFHETTEQRVAVPRRRGELGVELASNKPWMIRGFDYFHQRAVTGTRSEEPTTELQSLMRISTAVFCLKK